MKKLLILAIMALFIGYLIGNLEDKIAVIKIEGSISYSGGLFEKYTNSDDIVNILRDIEKDDTIKGIILEINSPGGNVVAVKKIRDELLKLKGKIPIVAVIKEYGASGAYWIASVSDKIFADEFSIVGSIGVTSSYLEYSGLMEKYGIEYVNITSGEYKDIGTPFRKPKKEEIEMFKKMIDEIYNFMINDIVKNRNSTIILNISDGRILLGKDAIKYHLIDDFGDIYKAKEYIENLTGEKLKLEYYNEGRSILDLFK